MDTEVGEATAASDAPSTLLAPAVPAVPAVLVIIVAHVIFVALCYPDSLLKSLLDSGHDLSQQRCGYAEIREER